MRLLLQCAISEPGPLLAAGSGFAGALARNASPTRSRRDASAAASAPLLALSLLFAVAAGCMAPPGVEPSPPGPPPGPPPAPGLTPMPRFLDLDPLEAVAVVLRPERLSIEPLPRGPFAVGIDASQINGGGTIGLLAKPLPEGETFAGVGQHVRGSVVAPGDGAEVLFFARSERQVGAILHHAMWDPSDERRVPTDARVASIDVTSARSTPLALGERDLLVELSRAGSGTVVLNDPSGAERARLGLGVAAWAMVDLPGTWSVACVDLCVGRVEIRIVSWGGDTMAG